jgi:hypothetical protein
VVDLAVTTGESALGEDRARNFAIFLGDLNSPYEHGRRCRMPIFEQIITTLATLFITMGGHGSA